VPTSSKRSTGPPCAYFCGSYSFADPRSELPTYDKVIPAILEAGIDQLRKTCKLTPGVPLKPMLAKPTKAIGEVLDRFENKKFTCEYKYDGERAQVCLFPCCFGESLMFVERCINWMMGLSASSVEIPKI